MVTFIFLELKSKSKGTALLVVISLPETLLSAENPLGEIPSKLNNISLRSRVHEYISSL